MSLSIKKDNNKRINRNRETNRESESKSVRCQGQPASLTLSRTRAHTAVNRSAVAAVDTVRLNCLCTLNENDLHYL